jgi:hypothetical protein
VEAAAAEMIQCLPGRVGCVGVSVYSFVVYRLYFVHANSSMLGRLARGW